MAYLTGMHEFHWQVSGSSGPLVAVQTTILCTGFIPSGPVTVDKPCALMMGLGPPAHLPAPNLKPKARVLNAPRPRTLARDPAAGLLTRRQIRQVSTSTNTTCGEYLLSSSRIGDLEVRIYHGHGGG